MNPALTYEVKTRFIADSIHRHIENAILQCPCRSQILGRAGSFRRPIGGQENQVGAHEGQYAGCFWKAAVVANVDADAQAAQIVNCQRSVAWRCEDDPLLSTEGAVCGS